MTLAQLQHHLLERGFSFQAADQIMFPLRDQLQTEIDEALCALAATGLWPELKVAGYTLERLCAAHALHPTAAVLLLDWLKRDAPAALTALPIPPIESAESAPAR